MPVNQQGKLTQVVVAIKLWLPAAREFLLQRYSYVRANPATFWGLPEVRYGAMAVGVMLLMTAFSLVLGLLRVDAVVRPFAKTADFYVICTEPGCARESVIHRKFRFDDFPVACAYCKTASAVRALRCQSISCDGKVSPTERRADGYHCLTCDHLLRQD